MRSLRRAAAPIAVVALATACTWSKSLAEDGVAGCAAVAARISEALKVTMNQSRDGANVVHTNAATQGEGTIRLSCPQRGGRPVLVTLSYPAEYPPPSFYDQLGAIGKIVTGADPARVRLQAHRCHRAAKRGFGRAHKRVETGRIDCTRSAKSSVFWLSVESRTPQLSDLLARAGKA